MFKLKRLSVKVANRSRQVGSLQMVTLQKTHYSNLAISEQYEGNPKVIQYFILLIRSSLVIRTCK